MSEQAHASVRVVAECAMWAVIVFCVSSCMMDPPPTQRAQIECIKAKGNWTAGNCRFGN